MTKQEVFAIFESEELVDIIDAAVEHHQTVQEFIHDAVIEAVFK